MQRTRKSLGILCILGAALSFAAMNLFVNLAGDLPLFQKVFFRNSLTVVIVFFVLLFQKEKFRVRDKRNFLWFFLRSLFGFVGILLNFYAIDHLSSISDASILNKLSPFFAILFSAFLLKERPTIPELIFVLLAFGGAMCVVNPRFDLQVLPALSGFLSGACAGFAYTCVRVLAVKGERGIMTVFLFALFSTALSLPFFIAFYEPMSPTQLLWLLLAGAAATAGQFFITAAYRMAPAKKIAVFDYAQVLFAALLGYFVLAQTPTLLSLIGYAVIIGAAFGRWGHEMRLAAKEGKAGGKEKTESEKEKAHREKEEAGREEQATVGEKEETVREEQATVGEKEEAGRKNGKATGEKTETERGKGKAGRGEEATIGEKEETVREKETVRGKTEISREKETAVGEKTETERGKVKAVHEKEETVRGEEATIGGKTEISREKETAAGGKTKAECGKEEALREKTTNKSG